MRRYGARFAAFDALDEGQLRNGGFDPALVRRRLGPLAWSPCRPGSPRPPRITAGSAVASDLGQHGTIEDCRPPRPLRGGRGGTLHRDDRHRCERSAAGCSAHEPCLRLWHGRPWCPCSAAPTWPACGAFSPRLVRDGLRARGRHDIPGRSADAGDAPLGSRELRGAARRVLAAGSPLPERDGARLSRRFGIAVRPLVRNDRNRRHRRGAGGRGAAVRRRHWSGHARRFRRSPLLPSHGRTWATVWEYSTSLALGNGRLPGGRRVGRFVVRPRVVRHRRPGAFGFGRQHPPSRAARRRSSTSAA